MLVLLDGFELLKDLHAVAVFAEGDDLLKKNLRSRGAARQAERFYVLEPFVLDIGRALNEARLDALGQSHLDEAI